MACLIEYELDPKYGSSSYTSSSRYSTPGVGGYSMVTFSHSYTAGSSDSAYSIGGVDSAYTLNDVDSAYRLSGSVNRYNETDPNDYLPALLSGTYDATKHLYTPNYT